MKKVAVINFSGNVGKSSISRYLLAPRMNCDVIEIESINDAGGGSHSRKKIRGKEFNELRQDLLMSNGLVVDIGASNVEDFMDAISEYDDGMDEFEYFVIPTVSAIKQQEDTVSTIEALSSVGVPANKIIVVFNQFDRKAGDLKKQFSVIYNQLGNAGICVLDENIVVPKHGFFEAFQQEVRSFDEVVSDDTDYRSLIGETKNKNQQVEYVRKLGMKSLAMGINSKLDHVYAAMTSS